MEIPRRRKHRRPRRSVRSPIARLNAYRTQSDHLLPERQKRRGSTAKACTVRRVPSTMLTVDGFPVAVSVAGPEKGPVVVMLGAAHHAPGAYDAVCHRLHTASLRTVVIAPDRRRTAKAG